MLYFCEKLKFSDRLGWFNVNANVNLHTNTTTNIKIPGLMLPCKYDFGGSAGSCYDCLGLMKNNYSSIILYLHRALNKVTQSLMMVE